MTFMRSLRQTIAAATAITLLACAAACGSNPLAEDSVPSSSIVVGSANFAESQILGEIYVQALNANGVEASSRPNIGSREVYIRALQDGSITLIPEYSGNLLQYFDPQATDSESNEVYTALQRQTPSGLMILDQSDAKDADTIVVSEQFSKQYDVTSLADLKRVSDKVPGGLSIAAPPEFGKRAYGIPGLKRVYGVDVTLVPVSDEGGQTTVNAVEQGTTTLAKLTDTSPFLADGELVALEDPEHLIAAQNIVPLANASLADNTKAVAIINAVQKKLTTEDLMHMNSSNINDRKTARQIAQEWLDNNPISG